MNKLIPWTTYKEDEGIIQRPRELITLLVGRLGLTVQKATDYINSSDIEYLTFHNPDHDIAFDFMMNELIDYKWQSDDTTKDDESEYYTESFGFHPIVCEKIRNLFSSGMVSNMEEFVWLFLEWYNCPPLPKKVYDQINNHFQKGCGDGKEDNVTLYDNSVNFLSGKSTDIDGSIAEINNYVRTKFGKDRVVLYHGTSVDNAFRVGIFGAEPTLYRPNTDLTRERVFYIYDSFSYAWKQACYASKTRSDSPLKNAAVVVYVLKKDWENDIKDRCSDEKMHFHTKSDISWSNHVKKCRLPRLHSFWKNNDFDDWEDSKEKLSLLSGPVCDLPTLGPNSIEEYCADNKNLPHDPNNGMQWAFRCEYLVHDLMKNDGNVFVYLLRC